MRYTLLILTVFVMSCAPKYEKPENVDVNIIFLHHSTGKGVWIGEKNFMGKISSKFERPDVLKKIIEYNQSNNKNYWIQELDFPKGTPYGWNNYPYDYYNIWVKNAGEKPFMEEPTLEMLTKKYNVIVFKHCFPVSWVVEDSGTPDVNSDIKSAENYKLQYNTLKAKLHSFPDTKFVVWTGAALNKVSTNEQEGQRAKDFFQWVKDNWNEPDDNIFVWDFREIETDGGLFLKDEYAVKKGNSHPASNFNKKASNLFVNRLIDIIENNGTQTNLIGEPI